MFRCAPSRMPDDFAILGSWPLSLFAIKTPGIDVVRIAMFPDRATMVPGAGALLPLSPEAPGFADGALPAGLALCGSLPVGPVRGLLPAKPPPAADPPDALAAVAEGADGAEGMASLVDVSEPLPAGPMERITV